MSIYFTPHTTDNVLKHFHTFEVYIPDKKSAEKILLKDRLKKMWDDDDEPKPLPPPKFEADEVFERLLKDHEDNQRKKDKETKAKSENQRQIE